MAVRARGEQESTTEVLLARSTASGQPVRLCTDRQYLRRVLQLGFTDVEVYGADKPVCCRERQRVYLWVPLGKEAPQR